VKLTVVGCSGSLPGPDGPASCYLLEADGFRLVVDLGNGSLGPLQRYVDIYAVDAVLLSHLHADHCLDLCSYYVARKYHPDGAHPALPVYGPAGTAARMARAYDLPEEPGMSGVFDFRALTPGSRTLGPFTVMAQRVDHPVEAYGVRVTHAGRTLTYSADTGPCTALNRLAAGADVLLCEATFLDSDDAPPGLHLTGSQAGSSAQQAGVGRLVLTHLPPWADPPRTLAEAESAYSGPVELARPGMVVDLP